MINLFYARREKDGYQILLYPEALVLIVAVLTAFGLLVLTADRMIWG